MPQVYDIHPEILNTSNGSISVVERTKFSDDTTIESERVESILRSTRRKEKFENIVNNTLSENYSSKYVFYGSFGLFTSIFSTSMLTLIPQHNVIEDPSYWYEYIIVFCWWLVSFTALTLTDFYWCTNLKQLMKPRLVMELWIVMATISIIAMGSMTFVWVYIIQYQNPVPFQGYILYFITLITISLTIWYRLPEKMRKRTKISKRFQFYIMNLLYKPLRTFGYGFITKILQIIPSKYQWVIAMILPIIKELHIALLMRINRYALDGDSDGTSIYIAISSTIQHTAFLAFSIGSTASFITSSILIFGDFITNIFICLYIMYLKRKESTPANIEKMVKLLQTLIVNEWVEVLMPLGYLISLTMGYYGPNSEIIGDVGCSYWQYNAIEDIEYTIKYLGVFFLVEVMSLIVCNFLVSRICETQIYQGFSAIQEEFGIAFTITMTSMITGKFGLNFISSATDKTGSFHWIYRDFNNSGAIKTSFN